MLFELGASPFFSVVIPVFNRYNLVVKTIDSILTQKNKNFEIILVDDGSTDGTGDKLDLKYKSEKNFKIIHQPNLERGAARNTGLKESKGIYVLFLDSDDLLLPEHLQVLFTFISALNFPNFIATKFKFLKNEKRKNSDIVKYNGGYYDYKLFLNGNPFACNICLKRSNEKLFLFEESREFSVKEDWLFLLQNLRYEKIFLIDKVTILMLEHEERSMHSDHRSLIAKTFRAGNWIQEKINLSPDDKRKIDAHINYFCAIHAYLDNRGRLAIRLVFNALILGGLKLKYIILLLKIILGRRIVAIFKR